MMIQKLSKEKQKRLKHMLDALRGGIKYKGNAVELLKEMRKTHAISRDL